MYSPVWFWALVPMWLLIHMHMNVHTVLHFLFALTLTRYVCMCVFSLLWYFSHWQPWYERLLWSRLNHTASHEFLCCCSEQIAQKTKRKSGKKERTGFRISIVFLWLLLATVCFSWTAATYGKMPCGISVNSIITLNCPYLLNDKETLCMVSSSGEPQRLQ